MSSIQQRAALQSQIWKIANDDRFAPAGVLAPKSKADFAFVLDEHIDPIMAVFDSKANYPLVDFVPQAVAQSAAAPEVPQAAALFQAQLLQTILWGHHAELMSKVKDMPTRRWYMQATLQNGWSRNILVMQIESAAHHRQGRTVSNFANRLPAPDSDFVQQTLKDPYYELTRALPENLGSSLPSIEEIERELQGDEA